MKVTRLYKRGNIWFCSFYVNGRRVQRSTHRQDKKAAEAELRRFERDAADPETARLRGVTLTTALELLVRDDKERIAARKRSPDTLDFHMTKAGHLVRLFERDDQGRPVTFRLSTLNAPLVDRYISTRRSEQVKDGTIKKELNVLRKSLRLAIRAGLWRGRVEEVLPVEFSPDYKPKERKLTAPELQRFLAELAPDRAARAAFMVATSANWRETERALQGDAVKGIVQVEIRGTKTTSRHRWVPIVTPAQRSLLDFVRENACGTEGALFTPWTNVRRDFHAACDRAGIERCSPNDLRRTFADWMVEAGVPLNIIALMMGHKDTRMLERVYGRQTPEQQAMAIARAPGFLAGCNTGVTVPVDLAGLRGPDGLPGLTPSKVAPTSTTPENKRPRENLRSSGAEMSYEMKVPGPGIEPGTRGFSVPCSTI
jgi:integrase